MSSSTNTAAQTPTGEKISTVRYSLPEMLAELKCERLTGTLAMEKLHQTEIGKLFQAQPKRRRADASR